MKFNKLAVVASIVAFAATPGLAHACSQQDLMTKAAQLSKLVQAKMAQDPTQGQALMAKMQPIMMANQNAVTAGGAVDLDKLCVEYDDLIKQAQ
jgi:hypothetical protein